MKKKIAVLNGDGIGPEVTKQSIRVLNAIAERFGHTFIYHEALIGADAIDKTEQHYLLKQLIFALTAMRSYLALLVIRNMIMTQCKSKTRTRDTRNKKSLTVICQYTPRYYLPNLTTPLPYQTKKHGRG
jgi:isocitrate dehydrogenase